MKNNIQKIYIYRILLSMLFPVPTIVLFWQRHGMSLTDVMVLQALFALVMVILELPSGYLADIIGRRKTLIYAGFSCLIAVIIYSQGKCFFDFFWGEMAFAIGFAFISGADAAMIYDTLLALGEETSYQMIFGRLNFYVLLAHGAANIIGGVIGAINYRWSFYAAFPFFFASILVAMSMEEPPRKKLVIEAGYVRELMLILKYCFIENSRLCLLIIYSGLLMGINNGAVWFYQPYFSICGLPIAYFGVAFASYQFFAAISARYAHTVEHKLGSRYSLIIIVGLISAGYFLMGYIVFLFSFLFAFFHQFARGFTPIVITSYINQLTESDTRATVLSAKNLIMRLFYAMLIPAAGKIADLTSIVDALRILGFTTLLIGIIMLLIMRKANVV